jgi:formate dehydrogenase subunit gamma
MLPVLHVLQEAFGCVPEAAVPMVAEALNLTRAEVHGVVTLYHDFRRVPGGRHILKLCPAEACQAAGGDALAARAEARLGVPRWARPRRTAASRLRRSTASGSVRRRLRR